ncbi:MAG: T9SS C-terminal target domain-containing protein [Calditrichaeota bacterium]|nr:MAG: T9SS C-terminal target domain-containing protein [Calditrichota bacterium]
MKTLTNFTTTISLLVGIFSAANSQSLTFSVDNYTGTTTAGPFMFVNTEGQNVFAYKDFDWKFGNGPQGQAPTSSSCTAENLNVVAGTGGITLFVTGYDLTSFHHLGTGDKRIYSHGNATINLNGNPVLVLTDLVSEVTVSYPPPHGAGNFESGFGQGVIDVGASDANWVAELDPFGTGNVAFEFSSVSPVEQNQIGYYDFNIEIKPITVNRQIIINQLADGNNENVNMNGIGLDFQFANATFGGGGQGTNNLFGMFVPEDPTGDLPAGIEMMNNASFWHLGTTMSSFSTEITFDLTQLGMAFDQNKVRILRRANADSEWEIYNDITVVNGTTVKANNVTGFSDWNIGEAEDEPLPVELSAFTAQQNGREIQLNWTTATELENKGFVIERATNGLEFIEISSYENNTSLIGQGSVSHETNYTFTDKNVNFGNTYSYRLIDVDYNQTKNTSEEVFIKLVFENEETNNAKLSYELKQNFPNPFNPTTTISFLMKKDGLAKVSVYNITGQLVKTLVSKGLAKGEHSLTWDGTDNFGQSVASGIYYYKLESGNFTDIKKMTLLK